MKAKTTFENLCNVVKAVQREKFKTINVYTEKQERSLVNNL